MLILLSSNNSVPILGQSSNSGILRITFKSFPYRPYDGDYASYGKLGDVENYVINIFTEDIIKTYIDANKSSIEMTGQPGKVGVTLIDCNFTKGYTNQARAFLDPENRKAIMDIFSGCGGITVNVVKPRPPYVDVPLPPGRYFLSYSLFFPKASFRDFHYACPNYVSKTLEGEVSIKWGPPSVMIYSGQMANIEFAPSRNIGSWEGDMEWQNCPTFWNYIEYLTWSGAAY